MQAGTIAAPKRLEDLNLRRDLIASLVLRTLAFADQLSGAALEARLGLPFETIEPIIQEFQKAQLMDTMGFASEPGLDGRPIPVRMAYTVSSAGRQRAAEMSAVQTRYLGPCPVRFEDYVELVKSQVSARATITDAALKQALGNLQLEQHVIDQIGGAMVSRSSLFIFGAPGNGKSTITERMALLMGAPIELPFSVAVGDEIIRIYDPVYHKVAEGEQPSDRRLVKVERPVVMAGGELKTDQLELTYDAQNRYYEAPLQWKANTGVLVIDDFGRQEAPANRILNRFIVPMEKKVDYLDLSASGRKIELPFLCQVVFSTNISPASLVDEAFLRRMAYKIGVSNPTPEAYTKILKYECDKNGVQWVPQAVPYLLGIYEKTKRPLRGSHPRQIIARLVDFAAYRQQQPQLNPQTLQEAFDACFNPALGGMTEEDWASPAAAGNNGKAPSTVS
jgi:predicted ATPase with chaperone activity